jgi:Arc/MetJ family transcription regulator
VSDLVLASGEVVDLSTRGGLVRAALRIRDLQAELSQARQRVDDALAEEVRREGRTSATFDGVEVNVSTSSVQSLADDSEEAAIAFRTDLARAGLSTERIDEVLRTVVKLDGRQLGVLRRSDPERYGPIIDRHVARTAGRTTVKLKTKAGSRAIAPASSEAVQKASRRLTGERVRREELGI